MKTNSTNLKSLDIIYRDKNGMKVLQFVKGEGKGFFELGSRRISLYEYNDYWKVITFIKGKESPQVKIFSKRIVDKIYYEL